MMKIKKSIIFILFLLISIFSLTDVYAEELIAPNYSNNELVTDAKSTVYPSKFTLGSVDGVNYLTTVKDQGSSVLCWSFAGTTVLESNLKYKNKLTRTFAPIHSSASLSYSFTDVNNEYGSMNFNKGGNFYDMLTYWTSGLGPTTKSFSLSQKSISTVLGDESDFIVEQTYTLPSFNNFSATSIARQNFIDKVKNLIINYGAVYFQSAAPDTYNNNLIYYNSTYHTVYTDTSVLYNNNPHAMVIVGWDDSFSKEKFNKGTKGSKPSENGAWIVQNSWGSNYGNSGYYYYSYEDYVIGNFINGVMKVGTVDYNNIYQYNPTGSLSRSSYRYGATVFDKGIDDELLTKVSFYVLNANTQVDLYVNATDGSLTGNNMKKVNSSTITIPYAGYYTYELEKPLTLSGSKFSVILDIKNSIDFSYSIPLQSYNSGNKFIKELTGILPNQSFTSSNRTNWTDQYTNGYSVFIKAFTENINSPSTPVIDPTIFQNKLKSGGSLIVKTFTENLASGTNLNYIIRNSSNANVTSSFKISKNNLINNTITSLITGTNIKDDIYTLEISSSTASGKVSFTVGNVTPTLSVGLTKITVGLNQTRDITYLINNPTNMTLTYKTDNKDIVTISNGKIKGITCGETTITVNNTYKIVVVVEEPIYINSLTDFEIIRNNLNGYYILNKDLDFDKILYEPIGNSNNPFTGVFIGNGHTITNLSIAREKEYTGMFGNTKGAYIVDFSLRSSGIVGTDYTGIIGKAYGSYISSIINYNNTIDGEKYVGGIIGYGNYNYIDKTINLSNVFGENYVGGIVGYSANSLIKESYNQNTINSSNNAGGISGYINNTKIYLTNNSGTINSSTNVGGIAGYATAFEIKNSYNTASLTGINVGGIIGYVLEDSILSTLDRTYNTGNISGTTYGGLIGNITGENYSISNNYNFSSNALIGTTFNKYTNTLVRESSSKSSSNSYTNFDFTSVWYMDAIAKLKVLEEASSIEIGNTNYTINIGEKLELGVKVLPTTSINKIINYNANNSNIKISNNTILGVTTGTSTLTLSTTNGKSKIVNLTITDAIKNNALSIKNNVILGLADETKLSSLSTSLKTGTTYTVYRNNSQLLDQNALLGTNDKISLNNNGVISNYELVVTGDVNGDGMVNVADLVKINRYILGIGTMGNSNEIYASDVTGDNKIQINDLVQINRYILEIINSL